MKKRVLALVMVAAMAVASFVGCSSTEKKTDSASDKKIAMITDSGDITDKSFNQSTYEAAKAFAEEKGMSFQYYKPAEDSNDARIASFESAVADGYNVIVVPGYLFAPMIKEVAGDNPEITIIALDVGAGDLGDDYTVPSNVCCFTYQEELPGYMAGYAAVKEGYTKLGFLGGMAVPAVIRYGFGFVQGANDAAKDLGNAADVEVNYVYGGQFFGDSDITAVMDTWYAGGTEVVFACGGGIYTSACEAAKNVGKYVIGVDTDQAATMEETYGVEGICITSAMKGLSATVKATLQDIVDGKWSDHAGKVQNLGLVSATELDKNYVQLSTAKWYLKNFSQADYEALVADMANGKVTVSNSIDALPAMDITVNMFDAIH